jgi:hypothetical protein
MKHDLSLFEKRQIARAVLEGLHGFQYLWPERRDVIEALDSVANSDEAIFLMLRGAAGAGISSILKEFALKYRSQVIFVTPRLYSKRLNMIGQVLHALFPYSNFRSHKYVPNSLMQFRRAARKIIIFDDLDIISNQNDTHEVLFDQLQQLARCPGEFKIIMSTRDKRLLGDYCRVRSIKSIVVPVSGIISAADVKDVVRGFYDWCNGQYDTCVEFPCISQLFKREQDMPIDRIIYSCETIFCSELLKISNSFNEKMPDFTNNPSTSESLYHLSDLRHAIEYEAFG